MQYRRMIVPKYGRFEVLTLVNADIPEPQPHEVVVRVLRAGVAFGDLIWQSGKVPGGPKPPYTPGYDAVGVVENVGTAVSTLKSGQLVAGLVRYGGYGEYPLSQASEAQEMLLSTKLIGKIVLNCE